MKKRKVIFSSVLFMANSFPFFLEPISFFSFTRFFPSPIFYCQNTNRKQTIICNPSPAGQMHSPDIRALSVLSPDLHSPTSPLHLLLLQCILLKQAAGGSESVFPKAVSRCSALSATCSTSFSLPIKAAKVCSGLG